MFIASVQPLTFIKQVQNKEVFTLYILYIYIYIFMVAHCRNKKKTDYTEMLLLQWFDTMNNNKYIYHGFITEHRTNYRICQVLI